MQVSFRLVFSGQCEAAFQFYERALGGKIVNILTYGNSPMHDHPQILLRPKVHFAQDHASQSSFNRIGSTEREMEQSEHP